MNKILYPVDESLRFRRFYKKQMIIVKVIVKNFMF